MFRGEKVVRLDMNGYHEETERKFKEKLEELRLRMNQKSPPHSEVVRIATVDTKEDLKSPVPPKKRKPFPVHEQAAATTDFRHVLKK